MFWNGSEWIDARKAVAPARPASRRSSRDILATIPILLLIPALIIPLLSVGADSLSATLTASGTAVPGGSLSVQGDGFAARDWVELRWDGLPTGITVRVGSRNSFTGQLTVPAGATAGSHEVSAFETSKNGKIAGLAPLAATIVQVESGPPAPTSTPTATPTPTPLPTPTPTPAPSVASPTPSPTPTTATIVSVAATNITQTGATITWTVSEVATGQVEYGKTTAYGTLSKAELSYLYATHVQTLSNLTAGTLYHYRVRSTTASGTSLISGDYVFTTPGATASPSPTPAPIATALPTPTPLFDSTRPFAAPVTTNVVNVSAGASLQTLVNAAPDGTEFRFPAATTFTMTSGVHLSNRHNLVFNLNGSTIKSTGAGGSVSSSVFFIESGSSHITVSNGTLQGSNPDLGSAIFHAGSEYAMGVASYSSDQIELNGVRVRTTYGDGVYLSGGSSNVWIHDSSFDYIGRMGAAFIATQHVIIERNTFDHVGLIVFDVEPNTSTEVVNDIHVRDNSVGWYSLSAYQTNWFFAAATASTHGILSNIYIEHNSVTGGAIANANNQAGKGGLATNAQHARIKGLFFRNNSTTVPGKPVDGYPAPLYFNHIDGLTVTGNVQPVTSGPTMTIYDSTSVVQ